METDSLFDDLGVARVSSHTESLSPTVSSTPFPVPGDVSATERDPAEVSHARRSLNAAAASTPDPSARPAVPGVSRTTTGVSSSKDTHTPPVGRPVSVADVIAEAFPAGHRVPLADLVHAHDPATPASTPPSPAPSAAADPTPSTGVATPPGDAATGHTPTRQPIRIPTDTFTVADVADQAEVTPQAVVKQIHAGNLAATRIGRRWLIEPDAAQAYIQRHQRARDVFAATNTSSPRPTPATPATPVATGTGSELERLRQENEQLRHQLDAARTALNGLWPYLATISDTGQSSSLSA